jgi:hypothetical protein
MDEDERVAYEETNGTKETKESNDIFLGSVGYLGCPACRQAGLISLQKFLSHD